MSNQRTRYRGRPKTIPRAPFLCPALAGRFFCSRGLCCSVLATIAALARHLRQPTRCRRVSSVCSLNVRSVAKGLSRHSRDSPEGDMTSCERAALSIGHHARQVSGSQRACVGGCCEAFSVTPAMGEARPCLVPHVCTPPLSVALVFWGGYTANCGETDLQNYPRLGRVLRSFFLVACCASPWPTLCHGLL